MGDLLVRTEALDELLPWGTVRETLRRGCRWKPRCRDEGIRRQSLKVLEFTTVQPISRNSDCVCGGTCL